MITEIAEIIVRELGPTGLLILVVGFFSHKAFVLLDHRIRKIIAGVNRISKLSQKKLKLLEAQNKHG